ncbi:MAG: molybdopterin-dependent oxidoreductase, partial [Actinobacteria bacterium]|nr:molybdopterin-dependent oxidoreductase [Actinomycetota bacterium]
MNGPLEQRALIVRSTEPLNAETPLALLGRADVTPTEQFFVRNHGAVPAVDISAYRLEVGGAVERPLTLSLDDLRARHETVSVPATLACAGNRRAELDAFRTIPHEMAWDAGAIGHATWTGIRLRDVLLAAGIAPGARHVAFGGLDEAEVEGERVEFGASIPLEKATAPEVLLAWAMNGEPLRPEHGFPLRVVVPGYIGARSVKWLAKVNVQDRPSSNYFQARGYRLFAADANGGARDGESLELGEFSLTSVVCRLEETARGGLVAEGYALAGGMRTVERVDV